MSEVNNEKLHIRLHVYDEEIEVTIKRSDEEFYRKAAKLITDRYNAYSQAYKGKKERGNNDTDPYNSILTKLTSEIEEALK